MIVPLAVLLIFALQGGRKLEEFGRELPTAVRADLIVQPQGRAGRRRPLTRRRATHSPPGVGQQTVDPFHPSPPLPASVPRSSTLHPARRRSARRASAYGPSRS